MDTPSPKQRWSSRHGDAAYYAGLKKLQEQREEFLHRFDGRKVHRVQSITEQWKMTEMLTAERAGVWPICEGS